LPGNPSPHRMLKLTLIDHDVTGWQSLPLSDSSVALWWLGQAGFAVRYGKSAFLIDPYLSDSLATKYKGKTFVHQRMMPAPAEPAAMEGVDWVFCTHRHTDHMDPDTLRPLSRNDDCRFLIPCTVLEYALENIGLDPHNTFCINSDLSLSLGKDMELHAVPAAHEEHKINSKGEHHFLGYILKLGNIRIYHSGDCVPYKGLEEYLGDLKPDIALLPVNGRDVYRSSHNVPGNFHYEEAVQLCRRTHIAYMIPHHFGMFDFNTVEPAVLRQKVKDTDPAVQAILPQVNKALVFSLPD
jgi:L-ascorbate metabolism protein UlaG (beta-lactamase superfamily)